MVSLSPYEEAEQIYNYAVQLAQALNLNVELVHHIDTSKKDWSLRYGDIFPENLSPEEVENIAVQERKNSIARLIGENAILSNNAFFSIGRKSIKDALKEASKRKEVELALITCDAEMASPTFRESYRIVESLECPVWRIPLRPHINPVKTIVYATDYKEKDIEAIKMISELAKRFSAKIIVLNVRKSDDYESGLKDAGLQGLISDKVGYSLVEVQSMESNKVAKGINDFCLKEYADLIVFLRKDKKLLPSLWGDSTIEKVIKTTSLPVLVYG
jgi:nucleotide-binding universal stress UspA family protein